MNNAHNADSVPPPETWFVQRIEGLRTLEEDWNSYGAPPISEKAIMAVCAQTMVPTAHGGITVEFGQKGWMLELTLDAYGELECCVWERFKSKPLGNDGDACLQCGGEGCPLCGPVDPGEFVEVQRPTN